MAAVRLARSACAEASTAAPALSPSPFLRQSRSCCPAFCCNSSNLCSSHRVSRLGTSSVAPSREGTEDKKVGALLLSLRTSFLPCATPFQHCATTSWLRHLSLRTVMSFAVGACHSFSWRDKCVFSMWCHNVQGVDSHICVQCVGAAGFLSASSSSVGPPLLPSTAQPGSRSVSSLPRVRLPPYKLSVLDTLCVVLSDFILREVVYSGSKQSTVPFGSHYVLLAITGPGMHCDLFSKSPHYPQNSVVSSTMSIKHTETETERVTKCNSVLWRNLSQRGCVGASVTSAEVRRVSG